MADNNFGNIINENASVINAISALDKQSSDSLTLFVVNNSKQLIGTVTDGDIRRALISGLQLTDVVSKAMNTSFKFIRENSNDYQHIKQYKKSGAKIIPFLDDNDCICGFFNTNQHKALLPIDAVLMAGGKGERLRPLTETTPKPLLKVGSKAIINHNIEQLIAYGLKHINVTVNYLHQQIEKHFENKVNDIKINCTKEPKFLGTIGAVKLIDTFYNDTILVMNSDLFTNIDYEDFFNHFLHNNADMSVAAVPYSINIPYGIFDLEGRDIKGVLEKPTYNYYANAGIYLIKKEILSIIPNDTFFNATDLIDLLVEKNKKVIRFPITGYWIDIGNHAEYAKANELAKHI